MRLDHPELHTETFRLRERELRGDSERHRQAVRWRAPIGHRSAAFGTWLRALADRLHSATQHDRGAMTSAEVPLGSKGPYRRDSARPRPSSGASHLPGRDLTIGSLPIDLSGASQADAAATGSISAVATGASTLIYAGTPAVTREDVSGASQITLIG